jgi:SAM-dependent methyltransferase
VSTAQLLAGPYFDYQRALCRDVLLPWLGETITLEGLRVGDFGAHYGGTVDYLRESGTVRSAVGLELGAELVAESPFVGDDDFRLEVADVTAIAPGRYEFDLVLLHDVLEHIPETGTALDAVARSLRPGGYVFVSFPPYFSAFGGHQQLASGRARNLPFVHYLPRPVFFRLARPAATDYMSADSALEDMASVRRTKLTLRRAERAFEKASFDVVRRELFLVRPEYGVRYGMRTRTAGVFGRVPVLREVAVNGAFYLLRSAR